MTGEPWAFANWGPGEPNDNGPGPEDFLEICLGQGFWCAPGNWNDAEETALSERGYIIEWDALFDLTVTKAGGAGGTVTSQPAGIDCGTDCSQAYAQGTSVKLTATPAPGATFIGWTGPCSGAGSCIVSMDGARSVTATFERIPRATRTLTVEKTGGGAGTVTSTPPGIDCGTDCSHVYEDATTVSLMAEPTEGSSFAGWSGCSSVSGRRCIADMNTDLAVTARFEPLRILTVRKQGGGSGRVTSDPDGIDCGSDCAAAFVDASEVVLTAHPGEGSKLGSWEGCSDVSGLECTVDMGQDKTVTANFVKISIPHSRKVSLTLSGHLLATGLVTVDDNYAPCADGVLVRIQRKKDDRWITIARPTTKEDGTFRVELEDRTRTYRARTPATPLDDGPDRCRDAKSPEVEHRHDDKADTLAHRYPT